MNTVKTNILIIKTNIKNKKKVKTIKPIFNNIPCIIKWSVDTEDIDNVLRIETYRELTVADIALLLNIIGFYGENLN